MGPYYTQKVYNTVAYPTEYAQKKERFENQVIFVLKPLILLLRFFGVLHCQVKYDEKLDTLVLARASKSWITYGMIIWLITTVYIVFQVGSLFISVTNGNPLLGLFVQCLWVNPSFLTYCISFFFLIKRNEVLELFQKWDRIEKEFDALFCPIRTKRHIQIFQVIYGSLAAVSTMVGTYHVLRQPQYPVYALHYLKPEDYYNTMYHFAYAFFHTLLTGWIWAGLVILEGICCLFATVLIQCMDTLIVGLRTPALKKEANNGLTIQEKITLHAFTVETLVSNFGRGSQTLTPIYERDPFMTLASQASDDEKKILFTIQKMQSVSCLQSKINSLIGPLLLIDVGHLVLLSCALTFLSFRLAQTADIVSTLCFMVNGIAVLIRLIVLMTSMGNVFAKGQEVNVALAKFLLLSNIKPLIQNPVLAYLTVFSSNPICFTAWGFFPITRGTLLTAFSVISTYAIIFVQLEV